MKKINTNATEVSQYISDLNAVERQVSSLTSNSEVCYEARELENHKPCSLCVVEAGFAGIDIHGDVLDNNTQIFTKVKEECEDVCPGIEPNDTGFTKPMTKGRGLFSGDYIFKKTSDYQRQQQYNQQYGQTPYYQQSIAGQPIFSTGPPPVQNAARAPGVQPGYQENVPAEVPVNVVQVRIFQSSFNSKYIRHRFIQRVYTILSVQLAISLFIILMCIYEPHMKRYFKYNTAMFYLFFGLFMVLSIAVTCYQPLRRSYPLNYIMLSLVTLAMGFMLGVMSTLYSTHIVWMAVGITTAITVLVSIFACQTRLDITSCAGYLCIASMVIMVIGLVAIIVLMTTGLTVVYIVYISLLVILFVFYLMFDTQMIMGGKTIQLSEEEYIAGALSLYVDIMYILLLIMQLLGLCQQ